MRRSLHGLNMRKQTGALQFAQRSNSERGAGNDGSNFAFQLIRSSCWHLRPAIDISVFKGMKSGAGMNYVYRSFNMQRFHKQTKTFIKGIEGILKGNENSG